MAEKIISPGVFTKEVDQTFLPAAISEIGAAVVGPTVKGPALVPTVVSSFSEYQTLFGDSFKSGSNTVQYLTSHTAQSYLQHASQMTVVRILDGAFAPATASILTNGSSTVTGVNTATGSIDAAGFVAGIGEQYKVTQGSSAFTFIASGDGGGDTSDDSIRFFTNGATVAAHIGNLISEINAVSALNLTAVSQSNGELAFTASVAGTGNNGTTFVTSSKNTPSSFGSAPAVGGDTDGFIMGGGTDSAGTSTTCFTLETLADGAIMNNSSTSTTTNNILVSGSKDNLRFEISNVNNNRGTFTLLIRRGDDSIKRKQILETFNNVSLDPNATNYIERIIGSQTLTLRGSGTSDPFLQLSGSFPRKSNFVRVKSVNTPLIDYLDENGSVRIASTSESLPKVGSGSNHGGFIGGDNGLSGLDSLGNMQGTFKPAGGYNYYDEINSTNSQGFTLSSGADGTDAYTDALNLLSNQDEYDINLILIPGVIDEIHPSIVTKAIDVCEDRGDCFVIVDPVTFGSTITTAKSKGDGRDSNFAAMYWPWVQVPDNIVGINRFVPPSVVMGGIYSFNDKVAHPWFAPAGLNRDGIDTAIQAERKLTNDNRDTLYESNINPIATFPGQGVTVFGQKTLQKKASALDRINVRRLLIALKKFIASTSRFLVFEQNNSATRRRFLNIVNPFMEQVQSNSGLTAFRVVMDDTNNTPDVIDRNILFGQIFVQPTRTAEFIVLDFTLQPTGATFPE